LAQLVAGGDPLAAAQLGIPAGSAGKACWLARAYPPELCDDIGEAALSRLCLSHLEVAAALPASVRPRILRRAADEALSVRALKMAVVELRAEPAGPNATITIGGSGQLELAATALNMYVTWPDENLARLLSGANGDVIRRLAKLGARLNERMSAEGEA